MIANTWLKCIVATVAALLLLATGTGTALGADARETLLRDLMTMNGKKNVEAELAYVRKAGILDSVLQGEIDATAMARSFEPSKQAAAADTIRDSGVVMANGEMAVTWFYEAVQKFIAEGQLTLHLYETAAVNDAAPTSSRLLAMSVALTNMASASRVPLLVATDDDVLPPDPAALTKLRKDMEASRSALSREPYWYNLMAEIMIIQRANPADVMAIVQEGLAAFPDNTRLVVLASNRFLPRWGGDAKRLADYFDWVSTLPALRNRPDMYARIYWNALSLQYKLTLFKVAEKDWTRMEPALQKLVAAYPTTENVNIAALMACLGGDRAMTRTFLHHEKFNPYGQIWTDPDALPLCWSWAG